MLGWSAGGHTFLVVWDAEHVEVVQQRLDLLLRADQGGARAEGGAARCSGCGAVHQDVAAGHVVGGLRGEIDEGAAEVAGPLCQPMGWSERIRSRLSCGSTRLAARGCRTG